MNLILTRTYGDDATTGYLKSDFRNYFTIEQPWRNNLAGHSCVPEGAYQLKWYLSPSHGGTYCMHNPDLGVTIDGAGGTRSYCELHSANWGRQLEGCIACGLNGQPMYDPLTGKVEPAIEESRDAIADLLIDLGRDMDGHTLTITSVGGYPSAT